MTRFGIVTIVGLGLNVFGHLMKQLYNHHEIKKRLELKLELDY